MSYLKIEFIPQFTMEALLIKATHRYEARILRDILTLDMIKLWKYAKVTPHMTYTRQTYWIMEGKLRFLIRPWTLSPMKIFTRGIVYHQFDLDKDPVPIFKLEIDKMIALMNQTTPSGDIRSRDGHVWDISDQKIRKMLRGDNIILKKLLVDKTYDGGASSLSIRSDI